MNKIKIIIDEKIPFIKDVLEPFADVSYYPGIDIVNKKVLDADALVIRTRTKCDQHLLENSKVKIITTATIGFDHIDSTYCNLNNIMWKNAPGCNSSSVMQYIATSLFYVANKYKFDLQEKTIGIVGVGNVGKKVEALVRSLGMNVLLNDPPRERTEGKDIFCSLEEIKEHSDIITFHVPLNKDGIDKTYHLANSVFFDGLKKNPFIINSSRGEVVETYSVLQAKEEKKISGIVLDVWENEPNLNLDLLKVVDIATPHIAGYSVEGKANGTAASVNSINKYFKLGLKDNWYPENLPASNNKAHIEYDKTKSFYENMSRIITHTYTIEEDHKQLINSPNTFEYQRGNYPVRREFTYYTIVLEYEDIELRNRIEAIGFKTEIKNNKTNQ